MKTLLNSFRLNGHALGFNPQTRKVRTTLYIIIKSTLMSRSQIFSSYTLNEEVGRGVYDRVLRRFLSHL